MILFFYSEGFWDLVFKWKASGGQVEGQRAPLKTCMESAVLMVFFYLGRQVDVTISDEMMFVTTSKLAESPARAERAYCRVCSSNDSSCHSRQQRRQPLIPHNQQKAMVLISSSQSNKQPMYQILQQYLFLNVGS